MRFLHTSDWHLGKGLHGHDLSDAQQVALDWLIDLAISSDVDAIVIAGDIFDRAFPSVEDVRRFNRALTRMHRAGIPIVCTSGNHDEGARLAAYTDLLHPSVTIVGEFHQVGRAIEFVDDHGPVVFYPLPYLSPDGARRDLAPPGGPLLDRSHAAVIGEAMRRVRADLDERQHLDPSTRAVVVGHAFVVKGSETPEELQGEQSDSERDISVGGVPSVPADVFEGVHYVALGHLHGPRTVRPTFPMVRYSGSLLRYSISERNHIKSVSIVDLDADGRCTVDAVPVPQPAGMARLRGDLADLLSDAHSLHHDDYVELLLTDSRLPDNYLAQLGQRFHRILRAVPDRGPSASSDAGTSAGSPIHAVTPLDTLRNYYAESSTEELSASMEQILIDVLERAQAQGEG